MRFGIAYGADAVYMAGQRFGMRAAGQEHDGPAERLNGGNTQEGVTP